MRITYTLGDSPVQYEMEISDEYAHRLGLDTLSLGPFSIAIQKEEE